MSGLLLNAEDEEQLREMLAGHLSAEGYRVIEAEARCLFVIPALI